MTNFDSSMLSRAQGCLLGQLAGDSLGGLVEFLDPASIRGKYPLGVRLLEDGGTWSLLAGQPTDDSEMALMLARMLRREGRYDPEKALQAYRWWHDSGPFDMGMTTRQGLTGTPNAYSQANGALMRISPLGIFGVGYLPDLVADWAHQDAALTHPHLFCQQINGVFARAISQAIATGCSGAELVGQMHQWSRGTQVEEILAEAEQHPPDDYLAQQGWVRIAFGNAVWQLLRADSLEEALVDTVMQGGDTDTNAAICGALLGAVYGLESIPAQWKEAVLTCRPEAGRQGVIRPRPVEFWPVDALEVARDLLAG
jgi:ADP-ribosyl-[dinitrogen reductase] hydrolase